MLAAALPAPTTTTRPGGPLRQMCRDNAQRIRRRHRSVEARAHQFNRIHRDDNPSVERRRIGVRFEREKRSRRDDVRLRSLQHSEHVVMSVGECRQIGAIFDRRSHVTQAAGLQQRLVA